MPFVDLPLLPRDLGLQMSCMRIWLDHHKIETAGFSLANDTARLAFRLKLQAEAFAAQFGGRAISLPDNASNGELSETRPTAAPILALAVRLPAGQRRIVHGPERSNRHESGAYASVAADSTVAQTHADE